MFSGAPMLSSLMPAGATALAPWMTNSWQPMLSAWLAMMTPRTSPLPATPTVPMIDPTAFSTYRSMGGFAVAQAFMDTVGKPPQLLSAGPSNPWVALAFPWLRH